MAGSFAQYANQSIVDQQSPKASKKFDGGSPTLKVTDSILGPTDSIIMSAFKGSDLNCSESNNNMSSIFGHTRKNRSRVDFSFQIEGSPERQMRILHQLSSGHKFNDMSSASKYDTASKSCLQQQHSSSNLFVVPEQSEVTPKNGDGANLLQSPDNEYIKTNKEKTLELCLKDISPIKIKQSHRQTSPQKKTESSKESSPLKGEATQ